MCEIRIHDIRRAITRKKPTERVAGSQYHVPIPYVREVSEKIRRVWKKAGIWGVLWIIHGHITISLCTHFAIV